MDKARFLDMNNRSKLAADCHELRAQLKEWEKSFADTNSGRKPGKEDIKKNPDIAAKYKTYNRTRDVLDGKKDLESLNVRSPSVRKQKPHSSSKRPEQDHQHTPRRALFATPRKTRHSLSDSHPSVLDPYDAPPSSVSLHPYVFKNAIGPTPQRDGKILGLFDFLSNSGSTPSTKKRKADTLQDKQSEENVAQTPSKKATEINGDPREHEGESSGGRRHSRTPASNGKKFFLSQFFATPSTMRFAAIAEEDLDEAAENTRLDQTPLRSKVLGGQTEDAAQKENPFENTPAYLKRATSFNQRLLTATGSNTQQTASNHSLIFASPSAVRTAPRMRPFKGKALSEILRGLRQMEDNDDEDEMDALREMEGNEMNVLVGDSQNVADGSAVEEEPRRTWKKKGQKRTTRAVVMKPATAPRKSRNVELEEDDDPLAHNDIAKVVETQAPVSVKHAQPEDEESADDLEPLLEVQDVDQMEINKHLPNPSPSNAHVELTNCDSDFDSDPDFDELASTPPPKKRKVHSVQRESDKKEDETTRPPTKPTEVSTSRTRSSEQAQPTTKQKTKGKEEKSKKKNKKEKGSINPNAHSHLNFRSLKIRNKNSKGKAKGRFGKGRR